MILWLSLVACSEDSKDQTETIVENCNENIVSLDTATVEIEPNDTGEVEEVEEEEPVDPKWDSAYIKILQPNPSAFIPLGEAAEFSAAIYDENDVELDFDDISWHSDLDSAWLHEVAEFTDDTMVPGLHTITASANLPNGDRVSYALGGILVQHPAAGIYAGTTSITSTFPGWDGNEVTMSCAGAVVITVSMDGQEATGDSSCILNILGSDYDTTYDFVLELADEEVTGSAIADLVITQRDFPLVGQIADGELYLEWADLVYGVVNVEGYANLSRVSLY